MYNDNKVPNLLHPIGKKTKEFNNTVYQNKRHKKYFGIGKMGLN